MEGIYVIDPQNTKSATATDTRLTLLCKFDNLEIMRYQIPPDSVAYLTPADSPTTIEYFMVLSGKLVLPLDDGEKVLTAGDCFYLNGLKRDLVLTAEADTEILAVSNCPMFDSLFGWQTDLDMLLEQMAEKDPTILVHSRNTMRIAVAIFNELPPSKRPAIVLDDLIVESLFHDIGNCFLPDEIVTKPGPYTPEEYNIAKQHSEFGANMLAKFGNTVANVVLCHHERLDGSGYPRGLKGSGIPAAARIIAVAECYETMIMNRPYKPTKSPEAALKELSLLRSKYDQTFVSALKTVVERGQLKLDE